MGGTEALILTALTSGARFLSGQQEARAAQRERDANVQAEANANAVVMEQMERQRRRQLGSTTAALSRSGVTVDTGSALDVLFDTDQELLLDKAIENFNSRNRQMLLYNEGNRRIGAARAKQVAALTSFGQAAAGGAGGLFERSPAPYGAFGNARIGPGRNIPRTPSGMVGGGV